MKNFQDLIQMGQKMQARMAEIQENLQQQEVSATSGGGMVTATVNGKGEVRSVTIDPTVVDPDDVEMLEDLVVAAVAEAQKKAQSLHEEEMQKVAGGLPFKVPGLF